MVETTPYNGTVYNLSTGDETFLVSNVVTHNCGARWGKDRCSAMEFIYKFAYMLSEDRGPELVPTVHAWIVAPIMKLARQVWNELKAYFPVSYTHLDVYKRQTIDQSKQELEKRREVLALEARLKDLRYIQKLDEVSETILDVLLEDDRLTNYLKKALDSGNVRAIQHILVSLGVTLDKREKLLGYDETRAAQTKKTQFKLSLIHIFPSGKHLS